MRRHSVLPALASLIVGALHVSVVAATDLDTNDALSVPLDAVTAEAACVRDEQIPGVTVSSARQSELHPDVLVYFTSVEARSPVELRRTEAAAEAVRARCANEAGSLAASAMGTANDRAESRSRMAVPLNGDFMTWSHNAGYTLMSLGGKGLIPGAVVVAHAHGDGFGTICDFKARVWGTTQSGTSYSQTSSLILKCIPVRVGIDMNSVQVTMKNGSGFYGQFFEDGAWAPGIPKATMKA